MGCNHNQCFIESVPHMDDFFLTVLELFHLLLMLGSDQFIKPFYWELSLYIVVLSLVAICHGLCLFRITLLFSFIKCQQIVQYSRENIKIFAYVTASIDAFNLMAFPQLITQNMVNKVGSYLKLKYRQVATYTDEMHIRFTESCYRAR